MSISPLNAQERLRAAHAVALLRTPASSSGATAAPQRQPDSISLSDSARALAQARQAAADAPAVREDRVAALKAALADGTYSVDSRQLARALARKPPL